MQKHLHAMLGTVQPREEEVGGLSDANSGDGFETRSSTNTRQQVRRRCWPVALQVAYLNLFLAKGYFLDNFLTRRLIGLWVTFVCFFQYCLILSTRYTCQR